MGTSASAGYYRSHDNAAIPAISLILRQLIQGATATNAVQLFRLAGNSTAAAQVGPSTSNPYNIAGSASIAQPTTAGGHGLRYFVTHVMIADPNGTLRTQGSLVIQLNNLTQGNNVFNTPLVSSGGADAAGPNQAAIYAVSGGAGSVTQCNAVRGTDSMQLAIQAPSTWGTATSFTLALFGVYMP